MNPPNKQFFLDLSDEAFEEMEIVLGPRMTEAEKILAKALVEKYCPNATCVESVLRVR